MEDDAIASHTLLTMLTTLTLLKHTMMEEARGPPSLAEAVYAA